jgi:hypothetical protein
MSGIPPSIADLIRRLSTNFDGEVVATVRAIDRKLKAAGQDWHDLARAVDQEGLPLLRLEPTGYMGRMYWTRSMTCWRGMTRQSETLAAVQDGLA